MKTKKILTSILGILWWLFLLGMGNSSFAQNQFHIMPELSGGRITSGQQMIEQIWKTGGKVQETYREKAEALNGDLPMQMATGIMDRSTLLDYVVYLVKFLSQLWLFVGAIMIIYAGYLYAVSSLRDGTGTTEGKKAITYAIIGILVISFSYAIIKFLTAMFLGT